MSIFTTMPRSFVFEHDHKETVLTDPDPNMLPKGVQAFYSATFPLLTIAKIEGPTVKDDQLVFRFIPTIGEKG